jgi:hypothetical protein
MRYGMVGIRDWQDGVTKRVCGADYWISVNMFNGDVGSGIKCGR